MFAATFLEIKEQPTLLSVMWCSLVISFHDLKGGINYKLCFCRYDPSSWRLLRIFCRLGRKWFPAVWSCRHPAQLGRSLQQRPGGQLRAAMGKSDLTQDQCSAASGALCEWPDGIKESINTSKKATTTSACCADDHLLSQIIYIVCLFLCVDLWAA